MNEVNLALSGTVVTDPVLRTTRSGDAFLTFRLAVNERRWKAEENTWVDGESQYFSVTAFRALAGNAYHSPAKGQTVMVSGRLRMTSYTAQDGSQRTSVQIDASDLGTSLKFGQTSFVKCAHPAMPSNDRMAEDVVAETIRSVENGDLGDAGAEEVHGQESSGRHDGERHDGVREQVLVAS